MSGDPVVEAEKLFAPLCDRQAVGLAVSGGADSLALLLLVARWREGRAEAPRIFVYSVDHGLRPEAAGEAAFVVTEATKLGLPARALRWEGSKPASGLQVAARTARYRLIAEAMAADGAELLLTAHHLADQAETVLMRLAHGSGVEGLRGMDAWAFVEGCEIYRPLLGTDPGMLCDLVDAAGLVPVDDPSNRDRDYERVRWRQLLPQLAALGLDAARLGTFAQRMADADAVIGDATEVEHMALVALPSAGHTELPHDRFALLPRAVAVRLLGQVLGTIGGNRKPHALGPLERLSDRLRTLEPLKQQTLHGCLVSSDGATIAIRREPGRRVKTPKLATEPSPH